ncbi:MAG: thiamine pyrophosphate-dependent enzyme [Dehalococcoidia bacterium]|nr:thiamine pyrophosphate-dependent enzyme [Dehalococcoidia bacterium]
MSFGSTAERTIDMANIATFEKGTSQLLMGNEAIARGALEAGIGFAAAYPGTPSSEIIGSLAEVAKDAGIYVEWSINEKVALEAAAAAAFAGVRSIVAMKQNGLSVALDYLMGLALTGTRAGIVLVTCDDPGALSSTEEEDSRIVAKWACLPLLEPGTFQEEKDMTRWAYDLSEELKSVVLIRGVTRTSHARGDVEVGERVPPLRQAKFEPSNPLEFTSLPAPFKHLAANQKIDKAREIFESSPFNWYQGPDKPDLLIVTCGSGWFYSLEAVTALELEKSVGILKLGTTWPLPEKLVREHLSLAEEVLVVEEIDPFLEGNLKELVGEDPSAVGPIKFYGKRSGHIPVAGEINPDIVTAALARILDIEHRPVQPQYSQKALALTSQFTHGRMVGFCAGCPHRATFWSIKNAIKLDGRNGFVSGDIGCYSMAVGPAGYWQIKTMQSMGSGTGMACGFGKLAEFGFTQPVIAVCGDSTFYHATIPAIISGIYNRANFTLLVLDNSATAMTGFQPHPGTGRSAMGEPAPTVDIPTLCRALGVRVEETDPFDLTGTTDKLLDLMRDDGGVRVMVVKRECALVRARREKPAYKMRIDVERCLGESCGCSRLCSRVFQCPALMWDAEKGVAAIDSVLCAGCGVCADICPSGAIIRETA